MTPQYVTIAKAAELTGLTQKAIRRKIESGVWIENVQFRRVKRPGKARGQVFINVAGVWQWVEAVTA